jgi:uncharacterized membrane protein YoaK (UPF0700 family)
MHSPPDRSATRRKRQPIQAASTHAAESVVWFSVPVVNKALANKLLPALLGGIAGSTDTIGFLALGGLFTAHITGNFIVLATHLVNHREIPLVVILSVPVFMAVLLLTRWLVARLDALGICLLQPLLVVEFLLLAGFLVMRVLIGVPLNINAPAAILAGMLGVAAMAVQNAVGQISLGIPSTTAMTANVARFALDLGEILTARNHHDHSRWHSRTPQGAGPLAGFVIGCGLGAACEAAFNQWSLALPVALAALALAISFAPNPRTQAAL